jgi:hypothetical protein
VRPQRPCGQRSASSRWRSGSSRRSNLWTPTSPSASPVSGSALPRCPLGRTSGCTLMIIRAHSRSPALRWRLDAHPQGLRPGRRSGLGCPPAPSGTSSRSCARLRSDAVKQGRLVSNLTDRATPPSPSQAPPSEMQARTAAELARFLRWAAARDPDLAKGWRLLAATGMRGGETLTLRSRDVDLDAGRVAVRRGVGTVKTRASASGSSRARPRRGRPGMDREPADGFAALLDGRSGGQVSRRYHKHFPRPDMRPSQAPEVQEHRGDDVSRGTRCMRARLDRLCGRLSGGARRGRPAT